MNFWYKKSWPFSDTRKWFSEIRKSFSDIRKLAPKSYLASHTSRNANTVKTCVCNDFKVYNDHQKFWTVHVGGMCKILAIWFLIWKLEEKWIRVTYTLIIMYLKGLDKTGYKFLFTSSRGGQDCVIGFSDIFNTNAPYHEHLSPIWLSYLEHDTLARSVNNVFKIQ